MKNQSIFFISALIALIYLVPLTLTADTIYLRNGASIIGKITNQSRTMVEIQTSSGTKRLNKNTIKRISYVRTDEERKAEEEIEARAVRKRQEQEQKEREEQERNLLQKPSISIQSVKIPLS